jgi:spermidine/putrescine transport system ATP-binding protein
VAQTQAEAKAISGAERDVAIRLVNVTKRFDDVVAVDDLTLEIERGTFFALLGPSGCGKTTTLRMIGGFEEPSEGTILLGDRDVTGLPPYKRDANTVFQSYALFPHLSLFENVAFGLKRKKVRGDDLRGRVEHMLEIVGLEGLGKRKPRQLSGGQQQRVALARALVNSPSVLLLDEPLGALDLKLRRQMQLELKRIQHEMGHDLGITFVHVTHDQEEAMTMADVIAVMNHGKIEQMGSATELYEQPKTAFVAGFLGVSNLLQGRVVGEGRVLLDGGDEVAVPPETLGGRTGRIAVGVRPEKLRLGPPAEGENALSGRVRESAYVGVSTQYVVATGDGALDVYAQNSVPGELPARDGEAVTVSWNRDCTFIVDAEEAP